MKEIGPTKGGGGVHIAPVSSANDRCALKVSGGCNHRSMSIW